MLVVAATLFTPPKLLQYKPTILEREPMDILECLNDKKTAAEQASYDKKLAYFDENITYRFVSVHLI